MSRPDDGQRPFLPFGNPFRRILPRGSHRLPPKLLALLNSFEQALAENLKKLNPNNTSDALSLAWLGKAMEFLSETHTNVKTLITDLQFPVSVWDEKWVDIYLDSSVKLLDICNALTSELSRLDQGQLLLQYALHTLGSSNFERSHALLHDWRQLVALRSPQLESCSVVLPGPAAKVKNSAKGRVLMRALYAVKVVTIFVCGTIVAVLLGSTRSLTELDVSGKSLWAVVFNSLQGDVNREIRSRVSAGKAMVVKELEAVEACVERLQNGISHEEGEKWREAILELGGKAQGLAEGIEFLSKQVEDFFQIVLTGRDALLCNLREPDVMQEFNVDESKL